MVRKFPVNCGRVKKPLWYRPRQLRCTLYSWAANRVHFLEKRRETRFSTFDRQPRRFLELSESIGSHLENQNGRLEWGQVDGKNLTWQLRLLAAASVVRRQRCRVEYRVGCHDSPVWEKGNYGGKWSGDDQGKSDFICWIDFCFGKMELGRHGGFFTCWKASQVGRSLICGTISLWWSTWQFFLHTFHTHAPIHTPTHNLLSFSFRLCLSLSFLRTTKHKNALTNPNLLPLYFSLSFLSQTHSHAHHRALNLTWTHLFKAPGTEATSDLIFSFQKNSSEECVYTHTHTRTLALFLSLSPRAHWPQAPAAE